MITGTIFCMAADSLPFFFFYTRSHMKVPLEDILSKGDSILELWENAL